MRIKTLIFAATIFLVCNCYLSPVSAQQLIIAAEKMNVAYIGIDNPLTIVSENYSCDDILATCDNGTLEKKGGCRFNFRPVKEGSCEVRVSAKTKKGVKNIGTKRYRIKHLPNPRASIGGLSSGKMTVAVFKAQKGMSMGYDDHSELECTWKILSYRVVIFPKLGEAINIENNGALFNEAVLSEIQRLKAGDRVIFENIKAVGPDGMPRSINSMNFILY